ncbi:acyltransferase family protein [Oikeobacillus pervagus]|nr:acyltransferase family protein [Oikeobacillus pervagus]
MTKRNFYFDNAKFILIFFVVFGHLIQSYIHDDSIFFTIYTTIYMFHMPAFILMSGFFAKNFHKKGYVMKLLKKLLLPYFLFQITYTIYYYFLYDQNSLELEPLIPNWSLWFLLSLFFWNILLILFVKLLNLRPAVSLLLAFLLGLAVGCLNVPLDFLSFSRTFVFFPFFLLGYYLKKKHFTRLFSNKVRFLNFCFILCLSSTIYFIPEANEKWLLGSMPYNEFDTSNLLGILIRAGLYILNLMMIACFFTFVPKKQFFFTNWGKNTLYVYLLHGFFIKAFRESEIKDSFESIVLLLIVSLLITVFLSSKFMTTIAQPVIELRLGKLKRCFHQIRKKLHYIES